MLSLAEELKSMASDLFKKYIWLADTIRRAGSITFAEINERWQRSTLSGGKRFALRTFHNHREAIEELFGIRIACDERTNRYYITDSDDLQRDSMANWLLDSFSVSNMLRDTQSLRSRILIENIPSSKSFLTYILEAMRENRQIGVTYQPFYGDTPFELTLRPLFVKLYERRWYLYADKPHEAKIKLYALDRMQAVRLTEKRFTPPADLDPGNYLSGAFGVAVYDDIKPCTIRIRAYGDGPKYLRTLPLHDSQQEIETTADYADFEYRVAPTYEFYRAVLAQHIDIEVLSPIAVRNETERIIDEMNLLYSRHKRRMIFLDFDGVLNTGRHIAALKRAGKPLSDKYGYLFDPESVANLGTIIDATGASVVISSSWKFEGAERMAEMWRERRLPGRMIDITEECMTAEEIRAINPDFDDPEMFIGKGNEIKHWLLEHTAEGYRYVILDDEPDILSEQRPNFIRIDPKRGITEEDARRAIEILNH